MCGIAGIWRRNGAPVETVEIARMLAPLAHRGPDGFAALVERDMGLGLGHARLKILDLSDEANQPMGLPDGSMWLSYNGEIHNFVELRDDLRRLGVAFVTSSDTEVVLRALRQWGEDAYERFNGMWALALWEPRPRRLTLARDRFGIKPLFWSTEGDRLAFASEAKSILAAFPEERRWSKGAMYDYLHRGWTDVDERTFFENIQMVPPGRIVVFDQRGQQERSFWGFSPGEEDVSTPGQAEAFQVLLDDAVRIRMRSDVPLGVCLSGGLDSSTVARLLARHARRPVQCFSLRYPGSPVDESRYAQMVVDGTDFLTLNWVEPDGTDLVPTLDAIVWHHDAPTVLRGRYPQWHVMRAASERVTVLLGGDGADELLGGYPRFFLPFVLDRLQAEGLRGVGHLWSELEDLTDSRRTMLLGLLRSALKQRCGPDAWPWTDWVAPELARGFRVGDRARLNAWLSRSLPQPFPSRVNNALWHELSTAGLPESLRSQDALGMAFSLESRLPFLDHRVVEFCFRLSLDQKIGDGWTKRILRQATSGLLPDAVRLRRRKTGFPGEYGKWLGTAANVERIQTILLDSRCTGRGIVSERRLRREFGTRVDRAAAHLRSDAEMSWRLVAQELWFRAFIDRVPGNGTHDREDEPLCLPPVPLKA